MVVTKSTKKFITKGSLKRELKRRPIVKKLNEQRTNRVNKARQYDTNAKADQALEEDFKKQLEKLVKSKKTLPGEDQVDFSDFLKKGLDSDDEVDFSDDDEGDLEFGAGGESLKGKKAKKAKKGKKAEEDEEDDDEEGEEYGSEGEADFDRDMIDTEGDELEEADEEEEGRGRSRVDKDSDNEEEDREEDEEGDKKVSVTKKEKQKAAMEQNLNKLLDENEDLDEEVDAHRKELQSLQELDPAFFEYLAKEGKDVLDFDKLSKDMKEKKQTETGGIITVTSKLLHEWITKAIEDDSIEDVKKILTAFQVSVMTEDEAIESQMPFRIEKETVFNELIVFCLEQITDIFYDLLEVDGKAAKPVSPIDAPTAKNVDIGALPSFNKIKKLVYIYSNVVFRLIEDSSDDKMVGFIISNLVQFIPFIATSASHTKRFVRSLLHIWATASKEARTSAYICIRQLTLYCPYPFINTVLRGIYLVFMQNSKSMNTVQSVEYVNFMRSCVVEIYGLDFECSYQHMFTYMRQLAVTLQKGLVSHTNEALSQVYSWQYLNALKLWTDVLSQYAGQENLKHLLYPLIQIIQGSITVDAHPKYYPYRIHLIRMLNTLASSNTSTFINSAPFCLDILGGSFMQSQYPNGDRNTVIDFKVMRRVSEKAMRTKQFQDALLNQVTELLATNLATYAYSVSFPELSTFVSKIISSFLSKNGDSASNTHLSQLLTSIDQNATHIRKLRDKADKSPKDITNPISTFFSPNLKNAEKAPLANFLVRFNKQVEKWEAILNEKRVESGKLVNYESDQEANDSDDDEALENSNDGEEEGEKKEKKKAKKEKKGKKEKKKDKKEEEEEKDEEEEKEGKVKKEKKRKVPAKLEKLKEFKEDVTGDMVLSDDGEEEEEPKQKKVKTDKPKANKPKQNGATEKSKSQNSKGQNDKSHKGSKPQKSNKGKK